ncbi:MAG: LpqB family beta-propeller domain-containing protein [Propionibacteriaceae bacterium]|nr:LpqB family beta-propeller domain-containing protein [Propionibacteriaceae bacterium]
MIRAVTAFLLALLLVGCTDINTVGPVVEVPLGSEQRGVRIAPEPPQPGVTPVRLVEGFVQAMAVPEANYSVARQYLTSQAATQWDPREGGMVYRGSVSQDDEGRIRVSGTSTGDLDADGRFTATGEALNHDFGVVLVDGEWRIGIPPSGVLVSDYIFERYWSHVTIYFMASAGDHVVPDLVHVPDTLLTPRRVVEAQIAGPSTAVAPVVRNAAGAGTRLAKDGASVDTDGTATVALEGLSKSMRDDRRRLLGAQLLWSLTSIPRVSGLRITNDGEAFPLPGQNPAGVLELASQQGYQLLSRAATSDLFGVRDGIGGRIGPGDAFLPLTSDDVPVSDLAVSVDGTLVGFIDAARTTVMIGPLGGAMVSAIPGWSNLRSAQFALGNLWVTGEDAEGYTHLLSVDPQGKVAEVDVSELTGRIVDFSITQAGARVAAVVQRAGGTDLIMASLSNVGEPRLSPVMSLPLMGGTNTRLRDFRSLDFSGETELVVLAEGTGNRSVFRARLDGSMVEDLGPLPEDAMQVSALPRPSGDAVVTRSEDGTVLRRDVSGRWMRMDGLLQEATFPG